MRVTAGPASALPLPHSGMPSHPALKVHVTVERQTHWSLPSGAPSGGHVGGVAIALPSAGGKGLLLALEVLYGTMRDSCLSRTSVPPGRMDLALGPSMNHAFL